MRRRKRQLQKQETEARAKLEQEAGDRGNRGVRRPCGRRYEEEADAESRKRRRPRRKVDVGG